MSNQAKRKLYDNGVLIRLKAPGWSGDKSDPRIREIIVNETGASSDAVSGSKLIVPRAVLKGIKAPVEKARWHLKEVAVPWSSNRTDLKGNRKEDGQWLVYQADLPALEEIFRGAREEREKALKSFLNSYDDIIASRRVTLGTLFDQEDYPTRDWLADKFSWTVEITPLWSLANVEKDLRMKLPQSWADEQVKIARREESKRISNAVADVANDVVEFIGDTIDKLNGYNPDATKPCPSCAELNFVDLSCEKCHGSGQVKDGRGGATFRDKTIYQNIPKMRERMTRLNEMFADEALSDTVDALVKVEELLEGTSGDDLRKDDKFRKDVAKTVLASPPPPLSATTSFSRARD
mgnify:FL=1